MSCNAAFYLCTQKLLDEWLSLILILIVTAIRLPTSRPTLPELLKFNTSSSTVNIVQQIGPHYSTLGPLLLNDNVGTVTAAIVSEHQRNADAINKEILTRWLQGHGKQPVTWSTLIDILKDVNMGLSELVQGSLNSSEISSVQTSGEKITGTLCCIITQCLPL